MKRNLMVVVAAALITMVIAVQPALAGTIKTWTTGENVRAYDLNANFSHIHTAAEAQITNSRVSSTAAIAHSKMATPALLPKAWAMTTGTCDGAAAAGTACTVSASSQVTSVTSNGGAGIYRLNLGYTPADASFGLLVTAGSGRYCTYGSLSTAAPHALITCYTDAGASSNTDLTVMVLDNT